MNSGIFSKSAVAWSVIAVASVFLTAGARAADPPAIHYVTGGAASQALVSGTSTLHDWTVSTSTITGSVDFAGQWKADSGPLITLHSIELAVPVDSIKSTEGSRMDNTMYDALKIKQCPAITYTLIKATLRSSPSKQDPAYHFETSGKLTVAGGARQVNLDLAVLPHDNDGLTISTDVGLKMTDFGFKPPTALLGVIKSGDAVTVNVSWQLKMRPPVAKAAK